MPSTTIQQKFTKGAIHKLQINVFLYSLLFFIFFILLSFPLNNIQKEKDPNRQQGTKTDNKNISKRILKPFKNVKKDFKRIQWDKNGTKGTKKTKRGQWPSKESSTNTQNSKRLKEILILPKTK